ncbi:unnamed protein product [Soboliphyme baturini]|uniref:Splicing factor 3A subunit 1 n=1 Tax=Soboliphyme baturini TaxID=241478 RepID=A0A183ISU6_9BILA|nr:unnamed protein product [Soboliphyme baturini]
MTREARNFQFDFLKPQHSNFAYFTKLVEQYTKILIPPKDIVHRLNREAENSKGLLESVRYRVEWGRYQKRLREREEAEAEKERIAYAQIDWHDFVVVQTVDFQPHESINLPPPCSPKDVGARLLAQQRIEAHKTASQTIEMEVESDSDEEASDAAKREGVASYKEDQAAAQRRSTAESEPTAQGVVIQSKPKAAYEVTQPVPAPPKPENVTVRKDYNPHNKPVEHVKSAEQKWVISPLTGEKIPADKLTEHMRYNTDEEPVFAPGTDISANIKAFAERRSDIFGVGSKGAEQTMIGKKLGEEDARRIDSKVIWDGHTASIEGTAKAAQSHISIEEQIAQIHRAQGLLPDEGKERIGPHATDTDEDSMDATPSSGATGSITSKGSTTSSAAAIASSASYGLRSVTAAVVPVVPVAPPVVIVQPPALGAVGALYSAAAPSGTVPTAIGYSSYNLLMEEEPPSKRQKSVEDLLQPEEEWLKLYLDRGPITVHVITPVSTIKTKVQELTTMPASKQKLIYENIFIKDSLSLAYYNMLSGSLVQLQLKERGGRKK